ncbi:hypothetical protein PSHT_16543 [Puccinia striiformis]|uniref:Uncharacterized protein n=1 Tax=Puccinia striiformis TaxID=27350 RepID=A0A2S4U9H1_9BASI|nr:hypothetical protein PSHT_16543 [Puccinia striiformis]
MAGGEAWALEVTGNLQRYVLTMARHIEFTLLNIKVTFTCDLAVLVSHIDSSQVEQAQSSVQLRSYAIVILEVVSSSALPVVAHTVKAWL